MSNKEKTSWSSIKTGFARTKHKVLASFGAAETTVDSKIIAEKDKLFTLFKLMKRLNKNVDKYEATLKEINIVQNEIAHDLLALNDQDPAIKTYQETQMALEQERIRIEEILENYYHDPLRVYLSQFRDIRSRLEELDVRRLDMDRYYRDYNIKANKGKDASSLQKTENKHQRTKEAYQELSDEIMKDMYALFDDRKAAFDPAFACFINKNNEYFARSAAEYQKALPSVEHINEYDAVTHPNVITPVEVSAMSTNVRASSVFTSPKEFSGGSGGSTPQRSRASTIATPTPSQPQPYQPPTSSYESPPSYGGNTYNQGGGSSGVNLSKPHTSPPVSHQPPQPSLYPNTHQSPPQQHNEVPYYSPPEQHNTYQQPQTYPSLQKTTSPNLVKTPSPNSGRPLPTAGAPANTTTSPFNNNKPRASTMVPGGRPLPTPVAPSRRAEALYDFEGQDSTELSFRRGDIITLFKENGDWCNAELNGKKGLIPLNHVRIL
ncbi:hypothetical protein DICPUDRAFT_159621 [Dictyostelium purpureum]|uniref:SH3 domain-containing protein n=1 Tax=Dictyostelium purpureum TaxID=5786 RepID=F1A4K0_DICPU|nr:uncharacterized protein DICPUDRAFT_159621 [Dictyostelium purpureum]EGC28883.1 hypothetical protein DICPUDRAFT_159621 [Dictyostelium purpureum]|eukprot:XP_003294594.1 hypothetical protein DICPUDRAFT_159621 [Dictyostelium purpureum]